MKSWVSVSRQVARLTVLGVVALSGSFGAGAAHAEPDPEAACVPSAGFTHCERFSATGADQSFTVPAGVSSVDVRIWGAGGGGSNTAYYLNQRAAGGGGFTTGTLAVTAGNTFTVSAGQGGVVNGTSATYGGGGAGGNTPRRDAQGASGGGLSALWDGPYGSTPLLVAGGGGGISPGSDGQTPYGGAGGGASGTADNQPGISGRGGSQTAGGAAATGAYCSTRRTSI
ncbi:glycine-rich protein, partial [Longispora urticae]